MDRQTLFDKCSWFSAVVEEEKEALAFTVRNAGL